MAACGIYTEEDDIEDKSRLNSVEPLHGAQTHVQRMRIQNNQVASSRKTPSDGHRPAPDQGPPLTLPFVIVDEACQSVEPANLIPLTSSNSCQSLVLLGDPCQLPPTVKGDISGDGTASPLSASLMSRFASILPHPVVFAPPLEKSDREDSYLNFKPTYQAVSLVKYKSRTQEQHISYRKKYSGSLLLSVQYRMHPSIAAFSSAVFYDSLLSTPRVLSQIRGFPASFQKLLPVDDQFMGVRFVDIGGQNGESKGDKSLTESSIGSSRSTEENTSYQNEAEANYIVEMLKELFETEISSESYTQTIGIVTPYAAQVSLLKTKMASDPAFRSLVKRHPVTIEVKSVDAYQGRERDLILFSTVRSNHRGNIGFLKDWRRMNVALTRAKSGLIVIGDGKTLGRGDHHWEAFVQWCHNANCVTHVQQ